jgi:hypothetical protein
MILKWLNHQIEFDQILLVLKSDGDKKTGTISLKTFGEKSCSTESLFFISRRRDFD